VQCLPSPPPSVDPLTTPSNAIPMEMSSPLDFDPFSPMTGVCRPGRLTSLGFPKRAGSHSGTPSLFPLCPNNPPFNPFFPQGNTAYFLLFCLVREIKSKTRGYPPLLYTFFQLLLLSSSASLSLLPTLSISLRASLLPFADVSPFPKASLLFIRHCIFVALQ